MRRNKIMVIDDENEMRQVLVDYLVKEGFDVLPFELATTALSAYESGRCADVELVITDLKMPQMDGLAFLKAIKEKSPDLPVIVVTAFGSIESAVHAVRAGAYDYVVKPFKLLEIQAPIMRALEYRRLSKANEVLRREVKKTWSRGAMVGKSPAMRAVFDLVGRVAPATSNVLILGESGTGKEMVARAIHNEGPRSGRPFVPINCTAIPENLLESELFGHARGSFTGAHQRKTGLFEQAHGGTLFLDEIGDMALPLQAKLLRVLQERKIRAVGDNVQRDVDVRVICATHQDLPALVKEKCFREDLYYRLSVLPIHVPPLRERKEDIPLLAQYFLEKTCASNGTAPKRFSATALAYLSEQRWEGNVRELENQIERAVVLSGAPEIGLNDLKRESMVSLGSDFFLEASSDFPTAEQLENRYIRFVLKQTGGKKTRAAEILGINRRTLYRKEKEFEEQKERETPID